MITPFTETSIEILIRAPFEERSWLAAHRDLYRQHLLEPQQSMVEQLSPFMQTVDPQLEGSVSRLYRDMRFGSHLPPLKDNVWITFQNKQLDPMERPAFFFELFADHYRYGMGFYSASRSKMERMRAAIDAAPQRLARLVESLPPRYQVMGELYKKSRASHLPEVIQDWYNRKSLWVQAERVNDPLLLSTDLGAYVQQELSDCVDLYYFLRDV